MDKLNFNNLRLPKFVIFIFFIIIGMLISSVLQNNLVYDFSNYHYYNAYAFLNNRLNYDIAPTSVQMFFNPILELPLYLYIQWFNDTPSLIYALQGIWFSLSLYIFYLICLLVFNNKNTQIILTLIIAVAGPMTWYQIGSSSNEMATNFLILLGLYILLKMLKDSEKQKTLLFFISGLIMGMALGLKPTVITYCLASGLSLIICYKYLNYPLKYIFFFAFAGLIGYLLVNGYFMYKYWQLYQNPFMPFLNNIFHSTYFENIGYRDNKFSPSLKKFFIYPFFIFSEENKFGDASIVDGLRLTLAYIVILTIFFYSLIKTKFFYFYQHNKLYTFLYIFLTIAFFLWMGIFSIDRYAIEIEMLSSIFITQIINSIKISVIKNSFYRGIVISLKLIIIYILITTTWLIDFTSMSDRKKDDKFIEIEEINIPDNAILKLYGNKLSIYIPFLNNNGSVRALGYNQANFSKNDDISFFDKGIWKQLKDNISSKHKGPQIIIYYDEYDPRKIVPLKEQEEACITSQNFINKTSNKNALKIYQKHLENSKYWTKIRRTLLDEMQDNYYCRKLNTNLSEKIVICVPKELKTEILGDK